MGFVRINNRNNFLISDVPSLHPDSIDYENYWRIQKRRCIEGFWGVDDERYTEDIDWDVKRDYEEATYRWMPPNLYFYGNFGKIRHNDPKAPPSAPKVFMRPYVRDIEWEFFYNWSEAQGFSGFEEDEEYSCYRDLPKYKEQYESGEIITVYLPENCKKADGTLKEYIPARQYLRKTFNKSLGKPLWDNQAKNLFMLGCLGKGSEVRMFNGSTKAAEDIKVGDELMGPDSTKRTVKELIRGENMMYKISSRYGESFTCSGSHMLHLGKRTQKKIDGKLKTVYKPINMMLQEFIELPDYQKKTYQLLRSGAVEYQEKDLKWHPYFLGLWLGDGFKHYRKICVNQDDDKEILDWLIDFAESSDRFDYSLTPSKNGFSEGSTTRFHLIDKEDSTKNSWFAKTLKLNKHIPEEYLFSSIDQRLELLAGLIDSDGTLEKSRYKITNTDKSLLLQAQELARSLGFRAVISRGRVSGVTNTLRYDLTVTGDISEIPCKVKRKQSKCTSTKKGSNINNIYIEPIGIDKFYGFEVDKDHLYLLKDYTKDHNARGFGKSYMVGVGIILYALLFDGAKYYTEETRKNPAKVEVFVGAAISDKSAELLSKAKDSLDRLPGEWGEGENFVPAPFYKNTSGSMQPNNAKNAWRHEYEEKVPGKGWVKKGSGTNIKHGIYTTENPEAAVGTRPQVMVIEEVGLLANVLQVHAANENCQTEGTHKIGSSIYLGTGGNMEKIRESETIFRNPSQYQFLEFNDEWEGRGKIGWFVPAEYSLNQFKDENGNTDFAKASKWLDEVREHKRKASSSTAIDNELMYRPRVPSEMFLSKRGNIFPINELRRRLSEIKIGNRYLDMATPVTLSFDKTATRGVSHKINHVDKPIHDFPINPSENNRDGCVVVYEFPITDESGDVPQGLYNIGHDPYAKDDPEGESLGSVFVMKTSKHPSYGYNEIVAEYVGRPYEGRHILNENIEKLAMFYGNSPGMIFFENARGNVKEYFEKRKKLYLLATQPRTILTKTPGMTSRSIAYGYPMDNKYVKGEAVRYARDWLLMEREEDGKTIMNLDKIWSKGLLEELVSFSMEEGNFDRAMAFLGCVIGLEETHNRYLREEEDNKNGHVLDFLENNPNLFPNKKHELNGRSYVETNRQTKLMNNDI